LQGGWLQNINIFLARLWEALGGSGKPLGSLWEASGKPLGSLWEASGRPLGGLWEASGKPKF